MSNILVNQLPNYINKKVDIIILGKDFIKIDLENDIYSLYYEEITFKDALLLEYNSKERKIRFKTKTGNVRYMHPNKIETHDDLL